MIRPVNNEEVISQQLDTLVRIKKYMSEMKIETDNCYPCYDEDGLLIIDEKTFVSRQCRDNMPQLYWFYLIIELDKNIYSVAFFDIRELCKKYELEFDENNIIYSDWRTLISVTEQAVKIKPLNKMMLELDITKDEILTVDTSIFPISCKEEIGMIEEIQEEIKDILLKHLQAHKPKFVSFDDEHYTLDWGGIKGELYSKEYESHEWVCDLIDSDFNGASNLPVETKRHFSYENEKLIFHGDYNQELINWCERTFWCWESGTGLQDIRNIQNIVQENEVTVWGEEVQSKENSKFEIERFRNILKSGT